MSTSKSGIWWSMREKLLLSNEMLSQYDRDGKSCESVDCKDHEIWVS